ncbi:MAG: ABC transporter ATP-binding protein [Rhodospirillaceae bacterium]|nr:ABC transporter ATP-binding protein [Rhodospirillaceae bacterium]
MTIDPPLLDLADVRVIADETCILDLPALTIGAGENAAILGANGSGKSTLVKLIARQLYPHYGAQVRIFGQESWNVFDLRKLLGIVSGAMQLDFDADPPLETLDCVVSGFFASRGLWAHQHYTQAMIDAARAALEEVGASHLIGRSMASLSTGEARRVLIARALAHRPRALLLDEPLTALDAKLRDALRVEIDALLRRLGITAIYVTHDQVEAMTLADRIVVMEHGKVAQAGTPREIYQAPATRFVADFIGTMNRLAGEWREGAFVTAAGTVPWPTGHAGAREILFRPESARLVADGAHLDGTVTAAFFMGDRTRLFVAAGDGPPLVLDTAERRDFARGDKVALALDPDAILTLKDEP